MNPQIAFLALFLAFTIADDLATTRNEVLQRNIACDLEQRALHLRLHCSLSPSSCGAWEQCSVRIDLARGKWLLELPHWKYQWLHIKYVRYSSLGAYANPYELSDKLPEVKLTIARKASREPSRLSRFFFPGKSVESVSTQEISLNASEVDIEAPSWKSDAMRWRFALDSQRQVWGSNAAIELAIPLHLRYKYA